MRKEEVDKYRLAICDGGGQRSFRFEEIKGLFKILEELPLTLSPFDLDNETEVDYYPEGGGGSATPDHFIRISPGQKVVVDRRRKGNRQEHLRFVFNSKCLRLTYKAKDKQLYTIEIDNDKAED